MHLHYMDKIILASFAIEWGMKIMVKIILNVQLKEKNQINPGLSHTKD